MCVCVFRGFIQFGQCAKAAWQASGCTVPSDGANLNVLRFRTASEAVNIVCVEKASGRICSEIIYFTCISVTVSINAPLRTATSTNKRWRIKSGCLNPRYRAFDLDIFTVREGIHVFNELMKRGLLYHSLTRVNVRSVRYMNL